MGAKLPRRAGMALLLLLATSTVALAHGVRHEVSRDEAVQLRLFHSDGSAFAGATVEIRRVGETKPMRRGRTDAQGIFRFETEDEGPFECWAYSNDGHGTRFEFSAPARAAGVAAEPPVPASRLRQIGLGLLLIAALFAGLRWFARRRAV